jgi:AcrR family transcriptional regulator
MSIHMPRPESRVPSPERSGVVEPKQCRGHETRARLVDACLRLVEDRPFEQISISEIAAEAGMSVGNFYRRFRSKEAILPDLFDAYEERYAAFAAKMRRVEDFGHPDLDTRVRALVHHAMELFRENRGLIRSLNLFSRLHPDLVPPEALERRRQLLASLGEMFEGAGPGDPILKGRVAAMCLVSTLREQVVYPDQAPAAAVDLDDDELAAQLVEMLMRYVGGP